MIAASLSALAGTSAQGWLSYLCNDVFSSTTLSVFPPYPCTWFSGAALPDAWGAALALAKQKLLRRGLRELSQCHSCAPAGLGADKAVLSSGSCLLAEFHPPEVCAGT